MTNRNIFHHAICRMLAAAVLPLLAAGSCTVVEAPEQDGDSPVIVTAYAAESALTRAEDDDEDYPESGPINSGTYYLTYPVSNNVQMAEVEFENSDYPFARPNLMPGGGDLLWRNIENSSRLLCLTNVSPEKHKSYNSDVPYKNPIIFKDDETQFVADRYIPYGKEGTNDILLGSASQNRNQKYISFNLHHCMARVRVIIETHPRGGDNDKFDKLDEVLDKAKVDIKNVVLKPYSFTPYIEKAANYSSAVAISDDGTLDKCKFGDINLLNTLEEDGDEKWRERGLLIDKDPKTEYKDGEYFITYDVLLPPQQLRTDDSRPRLVITVPDDTKDTGVKTYSGVLPHIMYDDEKNEHPLQLEFLAEHVLIIRTVISNDPPELIFMPVKVVEWVDKGSFSLDAQQAGIYNEADFLKMISYYEPYNKNKLLQFGKYKDDGTWEFQIFRNLSLSSSDIKGAMQRDDEKPDYSFNFNMWFTVTVDGEQVTAKQLKAILSGEEPEEEPEEPEEKPEEPDEGSDAGDDSK